MSRQALQGFAQLGDLGEGGLPAKRLLHVPGRHRPPHLTRNQFLANFQLRTLALQVFVSQARPYHTNICSVCIHQTFNAESSSHLEHSAMQSASPGKLKTGLRGVNFVRSNRSVFRKGFAIIVAGMSRSESAAI